jgi:hypothetical protein
LSNYSLELNFIDDHDSNMPFPPVARIYVQTSTGIDGDSHRYISLDCLTSSELDNEVDRLKGELENIRTNGHAKFTARQKNLTSR